MQIIVKDLNKEVTKKCTPPYQTDLMFPAPGGLLLLRSEEKISLYDVAQRKSLAELTTPEIKFAFWSNDAKDPLVALVGKDSMNFIDELQHFIDFMFTAIIIANKKLEQLCTVHETIRIKSGAWDENNIFIYSTLNHIKFCLPNGFEFFIDNVDVNDVITETTE
jgi:coatomer protein complex subunit alpha (xenin)